MCNTQCHQMFEGSRPDGQEVTSSSQEDVSSFTAAALVLLQSLTSSSGISTEIPHTLPKDEVALQQTARRFSSSSPPPPSTPPPPLPAAESRGPPGDGEEADEEDADTDDSDESDEELRTYSVQEHSGGEESEEECHLVPIVVSDNSEAHKLRSLLKMPTLLTAESLEEELEHKRKTVSFFDDVTVYLFDQVRGRQAAFSELTCKLDVLTCTDLTG